MNDSSDIDWRRRGKCSDTDVDPDMWFAAELETRRFAQHLCLHHCPVLDECRTEMARFLHRGLVVGGVIWSERAGVPVHDSLVPLSCFLCKRERLVSMDEMAFSAWR